jgi:hypothetical protein
MARLQALAAVAALLPAYTAGVAIGIDLGWLRAHQNSPHKQQQHLHAYSNLEHTHTSHVPKTYLLWLPRTLALLAALLEVRGASLRFAASAACLSR